MHLKKISLYGCSTDLLINYLKSLGVFRLLAKQNDSNVKACWEDNVFRIYTNLNEDQVIEFFLNEYSPSPITAPWNGGSGFFGKKAEEHVIAIEQSDLPRLAKYRKTLAKFREIFEEMGIENKLSEDKNLKSKMLQRTRQVIDEDALEVMDALYMLTTDPTKDGQITSQFGSLWGSGGNDGNLEFTNTFMGYLRMVIPFTNTIDKRTQKELNLSEQRLRASLFKTVAPLAIDGGVGQFFPGGAGGVNLAMGYEGKSLINPWDYVLALEGAVLFAGSVSKRLDTSVSAKAAFPFSVATTAAGWGTLASNEEGSRSRAEVWLPVWSKPASLLSVRYLFSEGRVQVGKRKAENGLDFARAVVSLGVDRGIDSFQRIGIVSGDRFGKMSFAVNLGYFPVNYHQDIRLLDEIDDWLNRWRSFAGSKGIAARYRTVLRNMEDAIFRYAQFGRKQDLTSVLINLGIAEQSLRYLLDQEVCTPLTLSYRWINAADDGTVEFRLAAALASVGEIINNEGITVVGSIREFFEPVQRTSDRRKFEWNNEIKMQGVSFTERLLYAMKRRIIKSEQYNCAWWPLAGKYNLGLSDVNCYLNGQVDINRVEKLFASLMLIDWSKYDGEPVFQTEEVVIDPAYAVLRLVFWPGTLLINNNSYQIAKEISLINYLSTGELSRALAKSIRRLRSSNLNVKIKPELINNYVCDQQKAQRLGASMLIPLSSKELPLLYNFVLNE